MRMPMPRCVLAGLLTIVAPAMLGAQAPATVHPPATAIHVSAADIATRAETLGNDNPSKSFVIAELGQYILRLEHRTDKPQNASVHEDEAELFYVVDGAATIRTGGSLVAPTRQGTNLTARSIEGGSLQDLKKGDVILIPAGVAHWVVKVDGAANLMSLHLPNKR
jgi:mannose-6-phosphate isomerase-like protein (cupin superfamily)